MHLAVENEHTVMLRLRAYAVWHHHCLGSILQWWLALGQQLHQVFGGKGSVIPWQNITAHSQHLLLYEFHL